ncbi:hypothetical protein CVU75_01750, partial [Candidatus Dependentiae bacterium HGW-Dependentiae-1]
FHNLQDEKEKDEKKKEAPLTHIFYGANKGAQFELLTCITANPLTIYWGERVGGAKPRMARVVYRLIKEKGAPVSYRLVRQESYSPLDWAAFSADGAKSIRQLELIAGIKSCTISYTVAAEKKSEKSEKVEKNTKKKKKKEYEYKESKEWKLPDKETEKEIAKKETEKKEKQKELPDFVTMKLVLWDDAKVREVPFEFTWAVGRALFGDFEEDTQDEELAKKQDDQVPSRDEQKKHFSDTMRKLKALQEKEAMMMRNPVVRSQMMAHNGMPARAGNFRVPAGVNRFTRNGVPGAAMQGAQSDISAAQSIVRVGDAPRSGIPDRSGATISAQMPGASEPIFEGQSGYVSDSFYGGAPGVEFDAAWPQGMPPEFQEQMYAYYNDVPVSAMDMRGR